MVINWLNILVRSFLPPCLLAFSLSVSSADSDFFMQVNTNDVMQKTEPVLAPELLLTDLNKQEVKPAYTNQVTLVHFWASWCLPCRKELPLIEKLQRDYHQQTAFKIVTIAADSYKNIKRYKYDNQVLLPILIDQYGKAMRVYQVKTLPSSYLIDTQGKIRYLTETSIDWSDTYVRDKIDTLLSEKNRI